MLVKIIIDKAPGSAPTKEDLSVTFIKDDLITDMFTAREIIGNLQTIGLPMFKEYLNPFIDEMTARPEASITITFEITD